MSENSVYITSSADETEKLGEELAQRLKPGDVVCLYGDLGSGKTTFVKGVAKGLGIKSRIISPTFILVRKHKIRIKNPIRHPSMQLRTGAQGRHELRIKDLYHVDLYRLSNKKDVAGIGLEEILEDKEAVVLIEWAERASRILPKKRWDVQFEYKDRNDRKIRIKQVS